jgi:Flp pilus assembly protein TadB
MQTKYISCSSANRPILLRKAGAVVASVVLAGLALMFSAVLLAVILIVGAIAWVYLWWKTRELRKQMQNFPPRSATIEGEVFDGEVIEGEVIRVDESRDVNRR